MFALYHRQTSALRYSITSSARSKNRSGMVRPSALAVLRLTTNSNWWAARPVDKIAGFFGFMSRAIFVAVVKTSRSNSEKEYHILDRELCRFALAAGRMLSRLPIAPATILGARARRRAHRRPVDRRSGPREAHVRGSETPAPTGCGFRRCRLAAARLDPVNHLGHLPIENIRYPEEVGPKGDKVACFLSAATKASDWR
jgi:hypothetical protein